MFVHGRNVHELFISSTSRVVRMHNLGPEAAKTVAAMLQANNVMLPSWSLHEQFGGAPIGHESSIWCVFRTHDDACRALQLDGCDGISVSSALEDDLKPFSKLRRFDMYDDDASLNINFTLAISDLSSDLAPMSRRTASPNTQANVIYSSNPDDMYSPSPSKNSGFLTPPTPTTALSSCGSSSEDGASPPSSTLSLYGQPGLVASGLVSSFDPAQANSAQLDYGSTFASFTMSTNPPSPRNAFKQGDWICLTQTCATHNFGRNTSCISCNAPRPLRLSTPATDYDRYFDARSTLPLSPPPPRRLAPLPPPAPLPGRQSQPPRLPSILTPSGRGFARGGRIQNVSPIPSMPLVMFWPDNEPLPQPCQIRPPFAPGAHPPIMNTGNRGPVEHQPGDWYCGKCSYMNWRRRKVCQTCFPFADGNADSVPASAQAERINMLAQMAQLELSPKSELLSPTSPVSTHGLGLQFGDMPKSNLDSLASTFGSLSLDRRAPSIDRQVPLSIDRRASVDHAALAMNRPHPTLRTRQSDAGLRLSGMPFSTRPRPSDGTMYSSARTRASDAGLYGDMGLNESSRTNSFPRRLPSDLPDAGLTYGLGRRASAANIWATDSATTHSQSLWPRA